MDLDFPKLYEKYHDELYRLSMRMRGLYELLQNRGIRATFGDGEGEVLYLLIRELKPETIFEISPDCGWSTNYILAALTENGSGTLHSFEIAESLAGQPTEAFIRKNLHPDFDQKYLNLHIGDARETTPSVEGDIDFLFLDSCHESFFGEWYIRELFPRVHGTTLIQDIAFVDVMEASGEADVVWNWLQTECPKATLVGEVENQLAETQIRWDLAERRSLRSNSVFFQLPVSKAESPLALHRGHRELLSEAEAAIEARELVVADKKLNQAVNSILEHRSEVNRHRHLLRAGLAYQKLRSTESERCFRRALGVVMQADTQQRVKGLAELARWFLRHGFVKLGTMASLLGMAERGGRWPLAQNLGSLVTGAATKLSGSSARKNKAA